MQYLKYIGIVSSVFMATSFYLCAKKHGKFSIRKQPLSFFGTIKETAIYFNLTVIVTSIMRIIYLFILIYHLGLQSNIVVIALMLLAYLSMFMVGFKPAHKNIKGHLIFGFLLFAISLIWLLYLHLLILEINRSIGYVGLFIAIIYTLGTVFLYQKNKNGGLWEAFFLGMIR